MSLMDLETSEACLQSFRWLLLARKNLNRESISRCENEGSHRAVKFTSNELREIRRLFRAKLRYLREQERAEKEARQELPAERPRRASPFLRRRARLEALEDQPGEDELLRVIEVARLLNVSPKTIGRWAADEGLPCIYTIGGHRRYYWGDVAAWLDRED
jgi:excisionase family DNA binding protein